METTPPAVAGQRCCGHCVHFRNDPATIESAFPGLTAMSSGSASVRAQDGLCHRHDLYLSFHDLCADFVSGPPVLTGA
ncbi:MAG: hypothetical protein WDN28_26270 [Chthoniobacter sp.]